MLEESSLDALDHQTNQLVPEQSKLEMLMEAKVTKLMLSYLGHFIRMQGCLKKTVVLGKIEGRRKRGTPNMRWINSMNEAIGIGTEKGLLRT